MRNGDESMKKIFALFGKNTILTVVVTIITLTVFVTSVYGFVKIAKLNNPVKDIPEVETTEQKTATPTTAPVVNQPAFPTPTTPPVANQQNNPVQNQESSQNTQTTTIPTVEPSATNNSEIEIDNDVEDIHEDDEEGDSGSDGNEDDGNEEEEDD